MHVSIYIHRWCSSCLILEPLLPTPSGTSVVQGQKSINVLFRINLKVACAQVVYSPTLHILCDLIILTLTMVNF